MSCCSLEFPQTSMWRMHSGVEVEDVHGRVELFERCLVGSHAPDTLQMLGEGASFEERTILGAFQYSHR